MRVFFFILGILVAVAGVCWIVQPAASFMTLAIFMGIVMFIQGVGEIVAWAYGRNTENKGWFTLVSGILSIILGVILLCSGTLQLLTNLILAYIASFWVFAMGVLRIAAAIKTRRFNKELGKIEPTTVEQAVLKTEVTSSVGSSWVFALVIGILLVILGVVCFVYPVIMMGTIGALLGIMFIFTGLSVVALATLV